MDKIRTDFSEICRICLTKRKKLTNIFEKSINENGKEVSLMDALNQVFDMKLCPNNFASQICVQCVKNATTAYNFAIQYEASYKYVFECMKIEYNKINPDESLDKVLVTINEILRDHPNYNTKSIINRKKVSLKQKYTKKKPINDHTEAILLDEKNTQNYLLIVSNEDSDEHINDIEEIDVKSNDITSMIKTDVKDDTLIDTNNEGKYELCSDDNNEESIEFTNNADQIIELVSVSCPHCNKSFKNKYILKAHVLRHEYKGQFICSICGKAFDSNACLRRHIRIHTEDKQYECDVCNRKFLSSHNLKLHSRTHSGIKPYLCTMCGKSFGHPTGLTYHMRTHTNERPHECEYCGKRFIIQCHYERHKKTHTGDRPFACKQCGRAFIKKFDLQRHEAIHSGKRPHKCQVCEKSFLRALHLKLHLMVHTDERPHICAVCGKRFIRRFYLKEHIKKAKHELPLDSEQTTLQSS